jgi:predicted O-methyltransferase YrrM
MEDNVWTEVDRYFEDLLLPPDPALAAALEASAAAGLPAIQVSPAQGNLLSLLARARGARSVLEIGTLGGYSTIWLARGLAPGGRVVSLEIDARHAEVARANIARAGLSEVVDVRLGPAADTLARMAREEEGPFDLVFIDADKPGYPDYLAGVLQLVGRGSLIVADNVVRKGAVADGESRDPNVRGVRRYLELLAAEPGLSTTAIQTVGRKGYDGFAIAVVTADRS